MLNLMNASKAEVAAASEAYRKGLVEAQARIREHLRETGGPEADSTLDSLSAVGRWYLQHLEEGSDEIATDWIPAWWNPNKPLAGSGHERAGVFTAQQLRLIDEVQAYVVEVVLNEVPDTQLAIHKGHKKDFKNGMTMPKSKHIGYFHGYFDALTITYSMALDVVLYKRPVPEGLLFDTLSEAIAMGK